MNDLKLQLYNLCADYIQNRIDTAQQAINSAQQSAGEETKSSAGDKYETSREMMQQETDRGMAQLNEANKLKVALNFVGARGFAVNEIVQPGSLVITNNENFYIAISVGAITYENETYYAVSPASPVSLQLMGKKKGDTFRLGTRTYNVEYVL